MLKKGVPFGYCSSQLDLDHVTPAQEGEALAFDKILTRRKIVVIGRRWKKAISFASITTTAC